METSSTIASTNDPHPSPLPEKERGSAPSPHWREGWGERKSIGHRIVVIGSTGSGKTTLARELARRLGYRHIEMDSIHWQPNWVETPTDKFRALLEPLIAEDNWTIDGNYSKVRDLVWRRADTLIWLDYSLPVIFWRLGWRSLKRVLFRQELWNGNREDWGVFFGRDSLFRWVLQSQPRHRREYPLKFHQPELAHLKVIHLHSPRETDAWLKNIGIFA